MEHILNGSQILILNRRGLQIPFDQRMNPAGMIYDSPVRKCWVTKAIFHECCKHGIAGKKQSGRQCRTYGTLKRERIKTQHLRTGLAYTVLTEL